MQDRIRQILEEQIAMRGDSMRPMGNRGSGYLDIDYGYGGAPIKGMHYEKMKAAAKRNPWIDFLQKTARETKIPYGDLLRDPGMKDAYEASKLMGHVRSTKRKVAKRRIGSKTTKRKGITEAQIIKLLGTKASLAKRSLPKKGNKPIVTKNDIACLKRLGFNETEAKKFLRAKGFKVPAKSNNLKLLAYNRLAM